MAKPKQDPSPPVNPQEARHILVMRMLLMGMEEVSATQVPFSWRRVVKLAAQHGEAYNVSLKELNKLITASPEDLMTEGVR